MIYFYYGNSNSNAEGARGLVKGLLKKKPNASVFRFDDENWERSLWEEKIEARGLFEDHCVVYSSRICSNKEAQSLVMENMKQLADSPNIFIFLEDNLPADTLESFKKYSKKIIEKNEEKPILLKKYNLFSLTDAVGSRDRQRSWVLLEKAYLEGVPAEDIHSIIFWQIKNILAVKKDERKAKDLGLKPLPLKKALQFTRNYTEEELKSLSSALVGIFHESFFAGKEMSLELESFVLSI